MSRRRDRYEPDTEPGTEAPTPPKTEPTATPDAWRRAVEPPGWAHAVASVAHGWGEHAYHEGAPMQLTRADYCAALACAPSGAIHDRALSPHRGRSM
jgi:hypothetical protein